MAAPTLDEQIATVQEQLLVATTARSIRSGDEGMERQDLGALRDMLRDLQRQKNSSLRGGGGVMLIEVEDR